MVSSPNMCLLCKGSRALCGNVNCPLLPRIRLSPTIESRVSKDFFGPGMNVFVGRIGYPNVGVGPLAAIESRPNMDSPASWFGQEYGDIIEMRSLMLRSKNNQSIFSRSRFIGEMQELALANKPTDLEMGFRKKPVYRVSFSDVFQPMGPTATIERMKITENTRIDPRVESIVRDELKAREASYMLYSRGQDVYKITTILSSGALGMNERKKLVPTRWSITATDDMIARDLLRRIRDFPSVNEFQVFSSRYLDNHFQILLMPGNWEYENFEAWAPGSFWSQSMKEMQIVEEYEPFRGRTKYADKEGGGYYAARLGVIEGLAELRRQARVVVFREVYEGYTIPMGVWVVRETARNALRGQPEKFATLAEAMLHIGSKLRLPMQEYVKRSRILKQRRVSDFGSASGFNRKTL